MNLFQFIFSLGFHTYSTWIIDFFSESEVKTQLDEKKKAKKNKRKNNKLDSDNDSDGDEKMAAKKNKRKKANTDNSSDSDDGEDDKVAAKSLQKGKLKKKNPFIIESASEVDTDSSNYDTDY